MALECETLNPGVSSQTGGSVVFVIGTLYRDVQITHPRCARFSLQNKQGLYFVKLYRAELVNLAQGFVPGTRIAVVGQLHSFVSRRCQNHHVFIKATALFKLASPRTAKRLEAPGVGDR